MAGTALNRAKATSIALQQIGKPYTYGAKGPSAFDCSGLIAWSFSQAGIPVSGSAAEQFKQGTAISQSQLQPGDAVFFKGADGSASSPGHEALYIGDGKVVVAPHTGTTVQVQSFATLSAADGFVGARRFGAPGGTVTTSSPSASLSSTAQTVASAALGVAAPLVGLPGNAASSAVGSLVALPVMAAKVLGWMLANPKRLMEVFGGGVMLLVGVVLMFRITTQTETVQSVGRAASSAASLAASPVKAIGNAV